ncbi:hypothetical protein [Clostridium butyricum]|uniref:hypothetical protein n=1 Tax=Clostridium butyricum TaxID=1492 RepID=UPI0002CAF98A|nr:hypothetical protein [Clostridium butyricum]EMU53509.1 hypothetical protein CBDKU1_24580 [Clostridium butyricum DKU-01]
MNLEEYLIKYKELTLRIMQRAKDDGSIGHLVEERQQVLEAIKKDEFDKGYLKSVCDDLDILNLEKKLIIFMNEEIKSTKESMSKLKKMHTANMQYNSIGYVPSYFNKKI